MEYNKALFIGRFQPFHIGHLKILEYIKEKFNHIIIGVGSSQYAHTQQNPFTFEERREMIKITLKKNSFPSFEIVKIPDIHNPSLWVEHVRSIVKNFDVVVTNNDFTKKLFEEKNIETVQTPRFKRDLFCGNEIRKRIIEKKNWKDLVPEPVCRYIKDINGVERIRSYSKS